MFAGEAYGRSLDDGNGLDNFLLVKLRAGSVQITNNGGYSSLVAHRGRQMDGLLWVILREAVHNGEPLNSICRNLGRDDIYLLTLPR